TPCRSSPACASRRTASSSSRKPDAMSEPGETLHEGRFLALRRTAAGWEYAARVNAKGCVAILAVTDDRRVVLTEQYRPPVGRPVIELPAGLAGDIPLQKDEPLLSAAKRELKEETGYVAKNWTMLLEGDRKSTRLNSSHVKISYAVFCLKKKMKHTKRDCVEQNE